MIEVDQALRLLLDEAGPLGHVEVALGEAAGLVLAEHVSADRDFPPTDRAAMDGFAVRAVDLGAAEETMEIIGEIRAGQPVGHLSVGRGQAVRIMTGAIVPPGADAVVPVEHVLEDRTAGRVRLHDTPVPGAHIRRRGAELRFGEGVLEPGTPIHAPEIAALAAVGRARVRVFRPPRVHVLTTGDEVIEPERSPAEHQVRNSNAPALLALLGELGLTGRFLGIAPDERAGLDRVLGEALTGDVLLISGGVSAGEYDLVGRALADAGLRLLFHGVAVRPGKPILAGRRGGCLVLGLPGNPVSTYATFALFVAPALRRMMGFRRWENLELEAVLTEPLRGKPGRRTYHLARVAIVDGRLTAQPIRHAGSGDVLALARANGFLVTPREGADLVAGSRVPALLWRDFDLR